MYSENYKTTKSVLSVLFVFSMLFSPFYYSVGIAFASEEVDVNSEVSSIQTETVESVTESPADESNGQESNTPEGSENPAAEENQNSEEETLAPENSSVEQKEEQQDTDTNTFVAASMMSVESSDYSFNCGQVYEHTCALPNSSGDSTVEPLVHGWDAMSLQDVFNSLLIDRSVIGDQKQYQTWDTSSATTTISIEFTNKISALNHVFGYYRNGDISTFTPIFRSGTVEGFAATPEFSFGQSTTLDIVGSGSIGFAIKTSDGNTYATTNSLNENGNDHAVAYDWANNVYFISFEDLALGISDVDYNDVTVKLTVNGCQDVPPNPYCPTGGDMTYEKFAEAQNAGLISFDLSATNTPYYSANLYVTNKTGCTVPISFASFKVFGPKETPQQFIDSVRVSATSTTVLQVKLANCMSQVDWFYGVGPTASTTASWPTSAFLMGFLVNATQVPAAFGGWDSLPPGGFCPISANTPPTITLIGANPLNLTVGDNFVDPGATATDLEDGDATTTSHIIVSGTVNASTTGSYILTYSVTDSGGLSASTTRTVVVSSVPSPENPAVSLSANPQTIVTGNSSVLSWNSQNTDSCSAIWTTSTSTSGTMSVSPSVTTDYAITCTGPKGSVNATTTVVVTSAPVNPPSGGGGGGIGGRRHPVVVGEILGATTCSYLRDYLKIDWQNDPLEVMKLQVFLNVFEKEKLSLTKVYDQATFEAVERFQTKYAGDILNPWGENVTTGFVYILTKKKVNEIYCNTLIDLSQADKDEIEAFRNYFGGSFDSSTEGYNVGSSENFGTGLGTLEDFENEGTSSIVELKDDSKAQSVIKNAAVSLFALPQKMFSDIKYLVILLILLAIAGIIIKLVTGSDKNPETAPITPIAKKEDEDSPIIILPGVLPDEEIVIENPEEGPEDVVINIPDLRDSSDKQTGDKKVS